MLGELDMLKNGINSMAMSLAAYHEEMQHNIDQGRRPICVKRWSRWKFRTLSWILAKKRAGKRRVLNPSFWQICHTSCVHH